MSAKEPAFAIGKGIGRGPHLSQIRIGSDMELTYEIEIIIQHFVKVSSFLSRLGKNHREMKRNRTHIEPADENRHILIICRMHTAPLIPGRQKCPTAHGGNNLSVLFVHAGNVTLTR